jgi:TPR repeat protein
MHDDFRQAFDFSPYMSACAAARASRTVRAHRSPRTITLKREDIEVRAAARAGDARASLAMAQRLFAGGSGMPRNATLGLAYLQQEIARRNPQALALVALHVPLETLAAHQLLFVLEDAARQSGCRTAAAKRSVWGLMAAATRVNAQAALAAAGWQAFAPGRVDTGPDALARALAVLPKEWLNPGQAALAGAARALQDRNLEDLAFCLQLAAALLEHEATADAIWGALQALAAERVQLAIPPACVEGALRAKARQGLVEAQYVLGRALAGLAYAGIDASQLVRERNRVRATSWLMRAADGGRHEAWFDLYQLSAVRANAADDELAARFYLEKAARCGVPAAQSELGTLLLAQARSLAEAEVAMEWLWAAAQAGCAGAQASMETLALPLPPHAPEIEREWLAAIAAADADLGMRATLARALGLTRHEALSLCGTRHLRPWGLVLPGSAKENPKGRIAPAVTPAMRTALALARSFYEQGSRLAGSLTLHRGRMQRQVFAMLNIDERAFFAADIGRSWCHAGWGRHWAARWQECPGAADCA